MGWLVVDFVLLRKEVAHQPIGKKIDTDLTQCDWHGIAAPSLILLSALLASCEVF